MNPTWTHGCKVIWSTTWRRDGTPKLLNNYSNIGLKPLSLQFDDRIGYPILQTKHRNGRNESYETNGQDISPTWLCGGGGACGITWYYPKPLNDLSMVRQWGKLTGDNCCPVLLVPFGVQAIVGPYRSHNNDGNRSLIEFVIHLKNSLDQTSISTWLKQICTRKEWKI